MQSAQGQEKTPIRSADHHLPDESQPVKNNDPLDKENPSSVWAPETDAGGQPPFKYSFLASLVGMSAPRMGRILRSGYNVPISPTPANIQVDWLCGGATVWRQDIVSTHHHSEIQAKWAICEDIIFSYPLSKTFKLYVCADARVLHEHVYDHNKKVDHRFYGRAATLWRLHFVSSNPVLSTVLCGYMLSAQIAIRLAQSVVRRDRTILDYALGQIDGLRIGFGRVLAGHSLVPILNELT